VLPSNGHMLDVLPRGVDKAAAVRHMALALPVVACGDSENDLSLWRMADLPVLMADSAVPPNLARAPWERMVRPRTPGPEGILEVLQGLASAGGPA
jgi:hydroxymethylpyrimidine pyrophosphatase-like HAD family hydrolase